MRFSNIRISNPGRSIRTDPLKSMRNALSPARVWFEPEDDKEWQNRKKIQVTINGKEGERFLRDPKKDHHSFFSKDNLLHHP